MPKSFNVTRFQWNCLPPAIFFLTVINCHKLVSIFAYQKLTMLSFIFTTDASYTAPPSTGGIQISLVNCFCFTVPDGKPWQIPHLFCLNPHMSSCNRASCSMHYSHISMVISCRFNPSFLFRFHPKVV